MTTLTMAKSKAKTSTAIGILPQVNLLPQSVFEARRLRATKRLAGLVLIGAVLLGGMGFGGALLTKMSASNNLAAAQQVSSTLDDQEAAYAEVPEVRKESARVTDARRDAAVDEILWKPVLDAFQVTLPSGTTIQNLSATMNDPDAATSVESVPLSSTTVATIQFTARSQTVPDVAAWMDALAEVDGFVDVWISQASLTEGTEQDTSEYYEVQGVIGLTDAMREHRFETEENQS